MECGVMEAAGRGRDAYMEGGVRGKHVVDEMLVGVEIGITTTALSKTTRTLVEVGATGRTAMPSDAQAEEWLDDATATAVADAGSKNVTYTGLPRRGSTVRETAALRRSLTGISQSDALITALSTSRR